MRIVLVALLVALSHFLFSPSGVGAEPTTPLSGEATIAPDIKSADTRYSFENLCPQKNNVDKDTSIERYKLCGEYIRKLGKEYEPLVYFISRLKSYINNVDKDLRDARFYFNASVWSIAALLVISVIIPIFLTSGRQFLIASPASIALILLSISSAFGWADQVKHLHTAGASLISLRDEIEVGIVKALNNKDKSGGKVELSVDDLLKKYIDIRKELAAGISSSTSLPKVPASLGLK